MAKDYVRASTHYHVESSVDHRLRSSQHLTMACWFNADDTTASALMSLSTNGGTARQQIALSGASQINAGTVNSGGTAAASVTTTTYSTGKWNHAVATFNGAASRASWLNGGGRNTETTSITCTSHDRTTIGARISGGTFGGAFDGRLAHPAIWSVPLNDAEIALLAAGASPLSVRRHALVRYWPMESDGLALHDVVLGAVAEPNGTPTQALYQGRNIIAPPKLGARIYSFPAPAGGGGSTGTLAATESGSDAASFTGTLGTLPVTGTLTVTESGSDTGAFAGLVLVQGILSTSESGLDISAFTGIIPVQGIISAIESGLDIADFVGEGAAIVAEGILAATESGSDTAAYTGDVIVQGFFSAIESSTDTLAFTGTITVQGTLAAAESGSDTARFTDAPPSLYTNVDLTLLLRI